MNMLFESSPLPVVFTLLWFAVPGIWLGAKAFCELLPADRAVRRVLQPAVTLCGWILAVELASVGLHSFWRGLPLGMIGLSMLGLTLWWRRRPLPPFDDQQETGFHRGMWLGMVLITFPIAILAFKGFMGDDLIPNGHLSTTAQLQNDYFPPRFPGYPDIPLRYHYGFDLVCAGLTALTRCQIEVAFGLATTFAWAYSWCLLWVLGERLNGSYRGGLWTAIATQLGGGAAIFAAPFLGAHIPWINRLLGLVTLGTGRRLNGPLVEYIFQRPFSLGLPLGLAVLVLALEPQAARGRSSLSDSARLVTLGGLLTALSVTQVVLFVTLSAAVGFTELVLARRWRFLLSLIGAWAAAWLMGGLLFTRIPGSPHGLYLRFWPLAVPESAYQPTSHWALRILGWYALTIGALLPFGLWGFSRLRPPLRVALLLLAVGGLTVPIFVGYRFADSIVKFFEIASLALGILSGGALTWLATRNASRWRPIIVVCLMALTATPICFISAMLWLKMGPHAEGQPDVSPAAATFLFKPVPLGEDDQKVVAWLRTHSKPEEVVYRLPSIALGYIQLGGLSSTPETVKLSLAFGVSPARIASRDELIAARPPDLAPYLAAGIAWFVVGPDDPLMERQVQNWKRNGRVHLEATFGGLQVFKIDHAPTASSGPK
ncbi:MAG TPA: hypothetical protein VHX65_11120 [Pirellulales bacterium]|jgi:hypothetical protein|nr:hypothetical protein [Pirellulales bacterium]